MAVDHVTRPGLDGFFVHLDADALDDAVMPAVDFQVPDGLSVSELGAVLEAALASDSVVGMEVTIYNPELDSEGTAGQVLVDILSTAFAVAS